MKLQVENTIDEPVLTNISATTDTDASAEAISRSPPPDDDEDDPPPPMPNPRPGPNGDQYLDAQRVFALLIAIDVYDRPGANLGGCVSDSKLVENYLCESIPEASERLHIMTLRSALFSDTESASKSNVPTPASHRQGKPTREGVIDAFLTFLTQARENDVVIVHYSGHGSYEIRPAELHHLDPEESSKHRAETLMCQDSFTEDENGNYIPALRDKEIRWLVHQVAQNNPHIVLLMDCCNAGGNTRFSEDGTRARFSEPVSAARNGIESYVFYQKDPLAKEVLSTTPTDFTLPEGRHLALYAGHSYQLAKEKSFTEGTFGVFTYFLMQTLRATQSNLSYRDLLKVVRHKATQEVAEQSPQWYASKSSDLDLVFMGGVLASNSPAYTLVPTSEPKEARLDAGALHGLIDPAMGKSYFTVFAADQDITELTPENTRQAELLRLEPDHGIVRFLDGGDFPAEAELLKAILKASPLPKMKVAISLELDEEVGALTDITDVTLRTRLANTAEQLAQAIEASPQLEWVAADAKDWNYRVFIYRFEGQDKLRITEKDKIAARVAPLVGWTSANIKKLVEQQLNHIAKWERSLSLQNPQPVILQPGLVELQAIQLVSGEELTSTPSEDLVNTFSVQGHAVGERVMSDHGGEIVLDGNATGIKQPALKFRVVLKRPHNKPLFCAMIRFSPDFGVDTDYLEPGAHLGIFDRQEGGTRIRYHKTELYAGSHVPDRNGNANPLGMFRGFPAPKLSGDLAVTEFVYYMKLIVSTEEFSPEYLYQVDLEQPTSTRIGSTEPHNTLDNLFQEVQLGDGGWLDFSAGPPAKISDWWTSTIRVVVKV